MGNGLRIGGIVLAGMALLMVPLGGFAFVAARRQGDSLKDVTVGPPPGDLSEISTG